MPDAAASRSRPRSGPARPPELRALQQAMYDAISRGNGACIETCLAPGRVPRRVRLDIYRNNLRETARKALAAMYPVIRALVGDACFRTLARLYSSSTPSRSGDLADYGRGFPALLAAQYAGDRFHYLAAVAELELACVESAAAPAAPALDPASLGEVAAHEFPRLRLGLQPHLRLIASRFPIHAIWRAHDTGEFAAVDLGAAGECVVVFRDDRGVRVQLVDAASSAFLGRLLAGDTLEAALGAAIGRVPEFDLSSVLLELHESRLLTSYTLGASESPTLEEVSSCSQTVRPSC